MSLSDLTNSYNRIFDIFSELVFSTEDFDRIKGKFKVDLNSNRLFERIQTITELLRELEKRLLLSPHNVKCFIELLGLVDDPALCVLVVKHCKILCELNTQSVGLLPSAEHNERTFKFTVTLRLDSGSTFPVEVEEVINMNLSFSESIDLARKADVPKVLIQEQIEASPGKKGPSEPPETKRQALVDGLSSIGRTDVKELVKAEFLKKVTSS